MGIEVVGRKGKGVRKVRVGGKRFEVPEFNEKPTFPYIVDKTITIYDEKRNSTNIMQEKLFDVARCHLPNNYASAYLVIDRYGLIESQGKNMLSIREVTPKNRKMIIEKASSLGWLKPKEDVSVVRLHEAQLPVDPAAFFERYGDRWREILQMFCDEGLEKDIRLVDAFKGSLIPLPIHECRVWQPYNNHVIMCTNSGVGKSTFYEGLLGKNINADLSVAGLIGSRSKDGQELKGELYGSGMYLIDEISNLTKQDYSSSILDSLLNYMESGTAGRGVKYGVELKGTCSLFFANNPKPNQDMLDSMVYFFRILQEEKDTERLARRFCMLLVGSDFTRIDKTSSGNTCLRGVMPRLIQTCVLKYWNNKLKPILKSALHDSDLVLEKDKDVKNTILAKADTCPNESVKMYIRGMSRSLKRIRFSAHRIAVLENFPLQYRHGYKALKKAVDEEVETVYKRLIDHNLRSIDNLTILLDNVDSNDSSIKMIKNKFPSATTRMIANLVGISHNEVAKVLKNR